MGHCLGTFQPFLLPFFSRADMPTLLLLGRDALTAQRGVRSTNRSSAAALLLFRARPTRSRGHGSKGIVPWREKRKTSSCTTAGQKTWKMQSVPLSLLLHVSKLEDKERAAQQSMERWR